ncbi:hypothetical protein niasHS_010798 [Heterodera schachtii]|uniref:Uncharacterized protein n=1 Tax=Heterodera schachtii TaxID=97005 RepID=A0ABD2IUS9_HETSC
MLFLLVLLPLLPLSSQSDPYSSSPAASPAFSPPYPPPIANAFPISPQFPSFLCVPCSAKENSLQIPPPFVGQQYPVQNDANFSPFGYGTVAGYGNQQLYGNAHGTPPIVSEIAYDNQQLYNNGAYSNPRPYANGIYGYSNEPVYGRMFPGYGRTPGYGDENVPNAAGAYIQTEMPLGKLGKGVFGRAKEGRRRNERKAAKETDRTEENTKKLGRE